MAKQTTLQRAIIQTKMIANDDGVITGMGWPFATPDRIGDMIEKGAFASASMPLPMLFAHDQQDPLGSWTEAKETDEGLELKGRLLIDDVARAREVRALIKAGAIGGISIGFLTKASRPRDGGGRTISEVELVEASLVSVPMHPGAQIRSAKSGIEAIQLAEAIKRAAAHIAKR